MRAVNKGANSYYVVIMEMKVTELKEELEVCVEGVSGNKVWLRRHLHAVIVREYLDGAMADGE